jgi:hypothetical protein
MIGGGILSIIGWYLPWYLVSYDARTATEVQAIQRAGSVNLGGHQFHPFVNAGWSFYIALYNGPYLMGQPAVRTALGLSWWLLVPAIVVGVFALLTRRLHFGRGGTASKSFFGILDAIPNYILLPQVIFLALSVRAMKSDAANEYATIRAVFAKSVGAGPAAVAAAQPVSINWSFGPAVLFVGILLIALAAASTTKRIWLAESLFSQPGRVLSAVGRLLQIAPRMVILAGLVAVVVFAIRPS